MASTIKVNNIQNQCGANIINESANTITLGASGDNIVLASGATQSGFGRTGTVDWDTTAKTASFTAVSGNGYFVNTTSGAITVTLPSSPSAGDIVALQDYAGTWGTNNITIGRNGSNIGGVAVDPTLSTSDQSITLVYVDATRGWQTVNDSTQSVAAVQYVTATGGTVTCCGDYKIHTFTGPGTFTVTCAGNPTGSSTVDYMVIAGGGGGGGGGYGGGAGAGGYRESSGTSSGSYTVSPLGSGVSALPVTATGYPITVGSGGSGGPGGPGTPGCAGSNSIFSTITSAGGGGGGRECQSGNPGGSGGGGSYGGTGGAGNTPPVSPPQGQPGGDGTPGAPAYNNAGGGGAGGAGNNGTACTSGPGGPGVASSITASPVTRAGGGGAGRGDVGSAGSGGPGGGGNGGGSPDGTGSAGTTNTGGGGGGGGSFNGAGGTGGSGIVVIRYKFQN